MIPGSPAPTTPAAPSPPLRRTWTERLLITFGALATVMSVLTAAVMGYALDRFGNIETVEIASVEKAEVGEPSNWLLVGTDSREGIESGQPGAGVFLGGDPSQLPSGKRTDTMIIARVDPENEVISLLSIPRDLFVPIAGTGGEGRINTAFNAENGEARLVDTIEDYFTIDINHYAEVNFVGFQAVVNELGGVPMWFDRPMRDRNSGLDVSSAGCITLGGFDALAFARARHLEYFEDGEWRSDPTGDLGRTNRQQYFLRRVVDTAASQVDLTSVGKINSLLSVGGQNLLIDDSVEPGDLLTLAKTFSDVGSTGIIGHSLPVFDFRTQDGAAVLGLQVPEAQPTLNIFRGLAPPIPETTATTVPTVLRTSVFNASGIAGLASEVSDALAAAGFETAEPDNAQARSDTIVRYPPDQAEGAALLISRLNADPVIEVDSNVESVVLIIGSDFEGLADPPRPVTPLAAASETPPTTVAPATETEQVGVVPAPTPAGTACG